MKSVIETYMDIAQHNPEWTDEEERNAIEKWYFTDKEKFVNEAFKHNIKLVLDIVGKHSFANKEDAIQNGMSALVEALRKYDTKHGKISTWVTRPIGWAMARMNMAYSNSGTIGEEIMAQNRRMSTKYSLVSLDSKLNGDDDSGDMSDIISNESVSADYLNFKNLCDTRETLSENEVKSAIGGLMENLGRILKSENEVKVITLILNGFNQVEISKQMNLSRMRITQLTKRAYDSIRASKYGRKILCGLLKGDNES